MGVDGHRLFEMLSGLRDRALVDSLVRLVKDERRCLAEILGRIGVIDDRRLYADEGYSSMFAFCTESLGYAEGAAYKRLSAARTAMRFPVILGMIERGAIHMTAVTVLSRHLTPENHVELLGRAQGKTQRDIELMAAGLAPKPDRKDSVRRLTFLERGADGAPSRPVSPVGDSPQVPSAPREEAPGAGAVTPDSLRHKVQALSETRIRISFTAGTELLAMIDRAKELVKHKHPSGELESVFGEVLRLFLAKRDPDQRLRKKAERNRQAADTKAKDGRSDSFQKKDSTQRKRRASTRDRHIPRRVKDAVWLRDGGRCTFTGRSGRRCRERGGLEFDHLIPFALGGRSDDPSNIRLLCKAHNLFLARRTFGEKAAAPARGKNGSTGSTSTGLPP